MLNLDEIKARAEAATPGPWNTTSNEQVIIGDAQQIYVADTSVSGRETQNARFIAHARQDIPNLITLVESLYNEIATLKGEVAKCRCETLKENGSEDC